jgi:hypothetical protein
MKIVTIKMELAIDEDITNLDKIADYLNNKLYTDPEFFGDFGSENIDSIDNEDGTPIYDQQYGWDNDPSNR